MKNVKQASKHLGHWCFLQRVLFFLFVSTCKHLSSSASMVAGMIPRTPPPSMLKIVILRPRSPLGCSTSSSSNAFDMVACLMLQGSIENNDQVRRKLGVEDNREE
jgi:hypothetical protein